MAEMKNKRNGFTLIEIVVTIALIAIVIPIIYNFISFGGNVFSKGTVKAETQNDVNLIAYKITNQLRTVGEISLTDKTGYSKFDVKSEYPTLDLVSYTLSNKNNTYMLNFTIEEGGHRVTSEIALNNVKTAVTGSTTDQLWVLNSESVSLKPQMSLGSASELFRKGDPTKVIDFPVATSNIPNNAILTVNLSGTPTGVEALPSPLVINNSSTIGIRVFSNADVGIYPFTVSYPGADDISGELHVLNQVDIYIVTFNKNGGSTEASPSSVMVQSGLSIGTSMPNPPSYVGYTFMGWNTESNGSGTPFDENSIVTESTIVYAMWASAGQPLVSNVKLTKIGDKVVDIGASNSPRIEVEKGLKTKMEATVTGTNLNVASLTIAGSNVVDLSKKSVSASSIVIEFNLQAHNGNKTNEDIVINVLNSGLNISKSSFYFITEK